MIDTKDGKLGIQCKCGIFNAYVGYVYAHRHDELTFTCECGRKYDILDLEYEEIKE